jgi:hypothetical protein
LIVVIDMVDEKLAADALTVVQGTAWGLWVSSEDSKLGLLAGRTGDFQRDGINVRLDHPL